MEAVLHEMRLAGWRVAVHNDYTINGSDFTFWLFTHSSGHFVRGEGPTDDVALRECLRQASCMTAAGALK